MTLVRETFARLSGLPEIQAELDAPLSRHTRFGIGGPADIYAETGNAETFIEALRIAQESGLETVVIGSGTNLIVSDDGFRGVVLKLANRGLSSDGASVHAESGVPLQALVDFTIDRGLKGLDTMTGIPGSTGAAVYGNAGAYGHSISESILTVRFFDGSSIRDFQNTECHFQYRESIFKKHKDWIILSADLLLTPDDSAALRASADKILTVRNQKYPPTMKCAGSIFKNFILSDLPPEVAGLIPSKAVIEGKVPSAWFLEQVGAKGMSRGDIHVAAYHANLIYNGGGGTARDLAAIIRELKDRVRERWGIALNEEVQYVGMKNFGN
ncbi:MAG: UDP-N-acetylmuramate dehydrogenase [Acidobacteriota bacterium]|nr:UDP-N-acetylmuramate dehydrogenase [Acidobacteriota bacterium]